MIDHPTLERFASQLSGAPVTISCDAPAAFEPGTLAFIYVVDGQVQQVIHLPRPMCSTLEHLSDRAPSPPANIGVALTLYRGKVADAVGGEAVLTLEHEALHIRMQSMDEGCVEATAIANVYQAVRLWKLAAWKVGQLLRGAAIAHLNKPAEYLTGVC